MAPTALSKSRLVEQEVYQRVRGRLEKCPYVGIFRKVSCHFGQGRLTLRGCVPSFYLKQMLQELLRGIEHVDEVSNEVVVLLE